MSSVLDPRQLRSAFGQFATGVTVIATLEPDGTPRGFTANSFTSLSIDPPLLLVCIGKRAASCEVFSTAPNFSVNVLAETQKDISSLFATQRPDKFDLAAWSPAASGAPLINDALAWFDCTRDQVVDAGDHIILIGRIDSFGQNDGRPLGYFRGTYFTLGIEDPLVDAVARTSHAIIGAIFEQDGTILLEPQSGGDGLTVPSVGSQGSRASLDDLKRKYDADALETQIEFVYGVFEDRRSRSVTVYYRGHATGPAPGKARFYPFDEIPWDRIKDSAVRSMLERYVNEARQGRYGLYMGDETAGIIKPVG